MKERALHEANEERLRIVPRGVMGLRESATSLATVNSRCSCERHTETNAPGQGRPPRHILSGLLR
jgi:hypothetical protein